MSLVIDLPPEMETRVREAAEAEGVDISTFLQEAAASRLGPPAAPRSMTDSELLEKINEGFPETFWNRYRALVKLEKAETLTPDEQKELIGFSDRTEARDVERLIYLTELSARRHKSVQSLMKELGIRPVRVN